MKLESICRICLKEGILKSVFTTNCLSRINISCAEAISKLSTVSIDANDGLPNQICKKCLTKLKVAYKLKLLCEDSHSKLIGQIVDPNNFPFKTPCEFNEKESVDIKIKEPISQKVLKNEVDLNLDESQMDYSSEEVKSEFPIKDEASYQPSICVEKYKFSTTKHLKSDLENETNDPIVSDPKTQKEKKFQCEFCAKIFVRACSLRTHILVHKKELPFICSHPGCDKAFALNSRLKLHLKVHTEERNFICHYCSHAARDKQQLIGHIRYLHTKEKNFICGTCGKGFATSQARYFHCKRHENVRNHHCPHCDKSFIFAFGLRTHLVTHTGERRFPCSICSARFNRKAHKVKHEVRIHGIDEAMSKRAKVLPLI